MRSILDVSVDSAEFVLGRALDVDFDVTITLEEGIPTENRGSSWFWVAGDAGEEFARAVESDPAVQEIQRQVRVSDATLYRAKWVEQVQSLLYSIAEESGTILEGVASEGTWEFTLRFPDREHRSNFRERCRDLGISLDVQRDYAVSCDKVDVEYGLTTTQRETLRTALETGYFRVPREATQEQLAAELGIESSSTSETLRRATAELIATTLLEKRTA